MSTLSQIRSRSQQPVRLAVTAAALAVVACFSAAFTFSDQSEAVAAPIQQSR